MFENEYKISFVVFSYFLDFKIVTFLKELFEIPQIYR